LPVPALRAQPHRDDDDAVSLGRGAHLPQHLGGEEELSAGIRVASVSVLVPLRREEVQARLKARGLARELAAAARGLLLGSHDVVREARVVDELAQRRDLRQRTCRLARHSV
jgi:hypothetical protein